ncbi:MAG: isocitrate lyase/phosphoenolpyruvate mutase family protein [Hyphomicrobium sp.]|uniref:isocitrate lyase/PEP mutase family protein n=1 Tax=Hyphomicrobium sp. CS1BSMeth3 TaxID=1892844 RepID=UPI00092FF2E7|nr:isocitrate lyase/phosphoenolpyruvate mutase family protein [Hyphomicrobium sp. CS1BSMeth3]MBN9262373.1 isocitrate lyase/phosphoenolpyruvate mutase family protein [Hyphomicrobium sp.]MBN9263312.1 isocitrate lyase/phosphoenolpyruvate mutase family protein [Hyphomicrobium sp.]MBN9278463.1 isocitrate lyase/phosphoenolpyruvate mutase family protein [Hyphomicrobium sp.]
MPSRWTERRKKFRSYLAGNRCYHPGSVHDPISARIASEIGFEIGMFAGSTGSLGVLSAPDLIILTLTEFADQALRINRAMELPLMVDADHGYGNALSVMRTVEELEIAGVSGMSIEDTALPQPFGTTEKPQILSIEEGIGKMKAALAARRDPDLCIAGRTSAPIITGIEDTIKRAQAYEKVGVDAIFLVGVKTRAELDAIAPAVKIPLILGTATPELMDREYLAARGVRICLQGHLPIQAAIQAIHDTMKALRDGTAPKDVKGLASADLVKRVTRADDYDRWTKDYLATKP